MKKLLSLVVVLAMMLSIGAVAVSAADYDATVTSGIVAEFKGSDLNRHGEDKANSDYYDLEAGTLDCSVGGGEFWGLYLEGAPTGAVLKMAFYMTVEEDQDFPGGEIKFRPSHEVYCNFGIADLFADNAGKVIVVVPFKVSDRPEGYVWLDNKFEATIDKVLVATADYDFGKDAEYKLIAEKTPNAGSNVAAGTPEEGSWTPSSEGGNTGNEGNTGDEDNTGSTGNEGNTGNTGNAGNTGNTTDNNKTDNSTTADVSVVLALVTAGAAAFGGLKLRKK